MPTYLDEDWLAAWASAVEHAGVELCAAAEGARLGVTTIVEDDEDGGSAGVSYHLVVGPDGVSAGPGAAEPTDLSFRQGRATALAVARGERNAQEAFLHGELVVGGDVRLLLRHSAFFRALDDALAELRATTTFDPIPGQEP